MNEAKIVDRIMVVLKNSLTYLVMLQTAITWLVSSGQLDSWPEGTKVLLVIVSGIGVAIAFIRRVTPVPKAERGLL